MPNGDVCPYNARVGTDFRNATPASSITARLALARDVARALLGTLDASELGSLALSHIARLVAADGAVVLLQDEHGLPSTLAGDPLRLAPGTTFPACVPNEPAAFGSRTWAVSAPPAPACAVDTAFRLEGSCHALVVPLHAREEAFGLILMRRRSDTPFHEDDLAAVEEVAGPLSLALENASLHRHLTESFVSLRSAQEELVRRERLAAVGTMATVLAHEVRTPIAVVFNAVSSLRKLGNVGDGDAATLLRIIDEEASRLESLVDDLLEFGRPPARSFLEVDAWQLLESAVTAVRQSPQLAGQVRIELAPRTEPILASWDALGVRQALVNVVVNACQAVHATRRGGSVRVSVVADAGRRAHFAIADDGDGVDADVRSRMFEPFVTSRPRGIGLGLAVVKRVVDDHGGDLFVDSSVGAGTRFDLVLPCRLTGR